MKFSTDYMKLIQLLDDGLINRLDESKPAKLLERDLDKAKQVKTLLESMIEDKNTLKNSLVRLLFLGVKTGLLNRWFGSRLNEVQSFQNNIDRLNCTVFLSSESEVICELKVLLAKVEIIIQENTNLQIVDREECA